MYTSDITRQLAQCYRESWPKIEKPSPNIHVYGRLYLRSELIKRNREGKNRAYYVLHKGNSWTHHFEAVHILARVPSAISAEDIGCLQPPKVSPCDLRVSPDRSVHSASGWGAWWAYAISCAPNTISGWPKKSSSQRCQEFSSEHQELRWMYFQSSKQWPVENYIKVRSVSQTEKKKDLIRVFTRNVNSNSSTEWLAVNNLNRKLYLSLAWLFSGTYNG